MKPFQLRVIAEKAELDIKLSALKDFINNSPMFWEVTEDERQRMECQEEVMTEYSRILGVRIAAWGTP